MVLLIDNSRSSEELLKKLRERGHQFEVLRQRSTVPELQMDGVHALGYFEIAIHLGDIGLLPKAVSH